ncbi:hypothetical protein [Streptosporangium sp. NPDC000396]|uniref:hypothetical protein n=1 Tax=Streptosporangium sp. NPDC000396 TaxID=3366185 RepID=UPI003674B107
MGELTRLQRLLPQARELPDGFSARLRDGWKPPFRPRDRECRLILDTAGGRPPKQALGAQVAATYPGDKLGELAGVGLMSYAGDDARFHFAKLTEALNDCRVVMSRRVSAGTSFAVSSLDMDAVGDEMEARRLRGRLNGYPYEMHMVFARIGHTLVSLVHAGVTDVDVRRTQELARFLAGRAAA